MTRKTDEMYSRPFPVTEHAGQRAKVSDGRSVRVEVPDNHGDPAEAGDHVVDANELVYLDGFLGFAFQGGAREDEIILNIEQAEYETDQTKTEDAMDEVGLDLFWDDGEGHLTTTPTAVYAGTLTRPKGNADHVIWFVLAPQLTAAADAALLAAQVGDVGDLDTTADVVVGAVNEILGQVGDVGDLDTTADVVVGAVNELAARVADHQEDADPAVGEGLPATLSFGDAGSNDAILLTANNPGPDGNAITIEIATGGSGGEAAVGVVGTDITVTVEDGVTIAADVVDAINADAESNALVTAYNADDSTGAGTMSAVGQEPLTGGTNLLGVPSVAEVNAIKDVVNGIIGKLIAADLMDEV